METKGVVIKGIGIKGIGIAWCFFAALLGGAASGLVVRHGQDETPMPVTCSVAMPDIPPLCCTRNNGIEIPRKINHGMNALKPRVEDPLTSDLGGPGPEENYPCTDVLHWG